MKKVYVTLLALLFGVPTIFAQTDNTVRLGIKFAPNLSWIRSDTKGLESDGTLIGYSFGLMTEFPFGSNGNYRFATGLFLNNIGGKSKQTYTTAADTSGLTSDILNTSKVKLRYIELPVTMKLMTNEIGYMRYYGQLGVDLGANIRAKSDAETITTTSRVTPRSFYRVVAIAEAVTWTLLIGGMLLKYVAQAGSLGVLIGCSLHGLVFINYGATAVLVGVNQHWPIKLIVGAVVITILTVLLIGTVT